MKVYPPPGQLGPRAISEWGLRTQVELIRISGGRNIPAQGPVMLVARHFHHLLDGAVLVTNVPRPIHIVVALDWAATRAQRRAMEWMCRAAEYPVVLRPPTVERTGTFERAEVLRFTRGALRETTRLLRAGRVVLVFPEGYPNIDPSGSRKPGPDDWLPFEPGFLKMIEIAERDGRTHVTLVPVGLRYAWDARWTIDVRIGSPVTAAARRIDAIERIVRGLSAAPSASGTGPHPRDSGD